MGGDVERYADMIQTALELRQKQKELSQLYSKLSRLMTVNELTKKSFAKGVASKAFKILDDVEVRESAYVKGILTYKDVEVHLFEPPCSPGAKAMKNCFDDISNQRLLNT